MKLDALDSAGADQQVNKKTNDDARCILVLGVLPGIGGEGTMAFPLRSRRR